jgi:hypothetical protein
LAKVSVIVPVYNTELYLSKCLDSLVNQTLKDIEIIVVNDGSCDNSQNIIDEYENKYKNIEGYVKKNGGLSEARNYGIKKATGEFLAFVDSDDYVDKNMLDKMYNKAKKEDLDIVVCDSVEIFDNGNQVLKKSNLNYSQMPLKNYIISPPMACTKIYKRELFSKVKFEKGIYYEDLNLIPSLVKFTKKIGFLEEGLYYYVQRNNSIMKQNKYNDKLLDIFKVLDNNKSNLYSEYPEEVEYLYITHLLRSASLRFVDYSNARDLLKMVNRVINDNFSNYKDNVYYKKSSIKLKIICFLANHNMIFMLKLLKRISGN